MERHLWASIDFGSCPRPEASRQRHVREGTDMAIEWLEGQEIIFMKTDQFGILSRIGRWQES